MEDKMELLHDFLFYSISSLNGNVELCFREQYEQNSTKYTIKLIGVRYLIANNFRQGNIVFDVKLFPIGQLSNEGFIELIGELDFRKSSARLNVLQLDSSYGCRLIATYEQIEIISRGLTPC